tara:strand:+ start:861 stop:1976 length:1116 start_codon:yes stop_codon:yes gene_type:complete
MKALVLGVGRMGKAIAYAMDKFGFEVVGMDANPDAANNMPEGNNNFFIVENSEEICEGLDVEIKPDVVISSLPYHQTEAVGKWCIDNGVRYCDLGGRVDVSRNINEYAKEKATKPVFTDLGLAPGWINIMAEWAYKTLQHNGQVHNIKMMVGGLPSHRVNPPLNYINTWSIDGLINEYKDDCTVLENGEIKVVPALDGVLPINGGDQFGPLEVFYTSGGASHTIKEMKERGVLNCDYRTVRYQGHRDVAKFLLDNVSADCVEEVFAKGCQPKSAVIDIVMMKIWSNAGELTWEKNALIAGDEENQPNGFTAMQKATAFPISSVAKIMAEGKLEGDHEQHRDYWTQYPSNLSYSHVPIKEFNENLLALGLTI